MIEEQPVGHKIARVQDDRWKHVEEEGVRRERGHVDAVSDVNQDHTNYHPDEN